MKPLFIIGYMGCGKSTFGKALSEATGLHFIDLDHYIEKRYGASIPQIFAIYGEEGFRKIERDMLREVCASEDSIIACGGGTPCFFDNIDLMNSHGTSLWLRTSLDCLYNRLTLLRHTRPLLANHTDEEIRDIIHSQLKARSPFYSRAILTWEGDRLENREQIEDTILAFLSRHPEYNGVITQ